MDLVFISAIPSAITNPTIISRNNLSKKHTKIWHRGAIAPKKVAESSTQAYRLVKCPHSPQEIARIFAYETEHIQIFSPVNKLSKNV